jgi:hypothetical protein
LFSGEAAAGDLEKNQAQTTADGLKVKLINGICRPWTISEDDLLRKTATSGECIAAIALRLQKIEDAMRSRAFRLRFR